jgi:hypothetical protein
VSVSADKFTFSSLNVVILLPGYERKANAHRKRFFDEQPA